MANFIWYVEQGVTAALATSFAVIPLYTTDVEAELFKNRALFGGAQGAVTEPHGLDVDPFTVFMDTGQLVPGIKATLVGVAYPGPEMKNEKISLKLEHV